MGVSRCRLSANLFDHADINISFASSHCRDYIASIRHAVNGCTREETTSRIGNVQPKSNSSYNWSFKSVSYGNTSDYEAVNRNCFAVL